MTTKTYFWVSKETSKEAAAERLAASEGSEEAQNGKETLVYSYEFPPEFIASRNPKWIVIEECKATFKNQLVGNVILHASFIHRDHYLDHACCFVNEEANKDTAKYEYNSNVARFELWFTDLHGNHVDMDGFVFRSLLIY